MAISDVLWEIETAIDDVIDESDRPLDRQTAQTRRSIYEQTLADVLYLADTDAMHTLGNWIIREIRVAERLPERHEVQQVGREICRRQPPHSSGAAL